jgi:glucose-6-phosphate isomerase
VFIQVVGADHTDAAVPGREFTFGRLKRAQADGDLLTLAAHHLRAGRYTVDDLLAHLATS